MTDRWKMNRIGFVNFWLYDEENFEFVDGKLLLRGQNGSGKSITTQSFIPFVLDGDRTPSRLDPFGSSDRRMEYYFLGEEGKDESTGYLFLEFKKEGTEEYRTIGIGQRAKRGKPMDFWGFVILDQKRIGYDLLLYKKVGSSKIPLDRREMRALLGEENFFTDSQSEYKKHVNQYIFGFRKEEQYEQFIKLLVKVRAPKLSKEFKPTKVYEILNDSLQTLTDEDLRAMVDAMEKMDEIQDSLEMLNRAFADIKIIRNEYTRYNQYMLAKKAQAYLQKKQEAEEAQKNLERQKQEIQLVESTFREKEQRLKALEEQRTLAETERNGLLDMDLEGIDRKLEDARKQRQIAQEDETRWNNRIQDYNGKIWQSEQQLKKIQDQLEARRESISEFKEELQEQQEILQWEQHPQMIQALEQEDQERVEERTKELETRRKFMEECQRTLRQYEDVSRRYDEVLETLEYLKKKKEEKNQDLLDVQNQVLEQIDRWIAEVYELEKQAVRWHPDSAVLRKAEEKVKEYQSMEDAGEIQELFRKSYEEQRQNLLDQKNSRENERKIQFEIWKQEKEQLSTLLKQEELEPERSEKTRASRIALEKAGITAIPFYKTVEFSGDLDSASCARLEAQLQNAGILDALVVSAKDFDRIRTECPEFLDTVLWVEEDGDSRFDALTVSEELDPEIQQTVRRILSNIYTDQDQAPSDEKLTAGVCFGTDGWFRQGMVFGRAEKTGDAEFVGFLARKRRKEQKIHELENGIQMQEKRIGELDQEIEKWKEDLKILQREYQKLPGFSDLNTILNRERECQFLLKQVTDEYNQKELSEKKLAQEKNNQYQSVLQACKPFPYGRTEHAYREAMDALEAYRSICQEISQCLLKLENEKEAGMTQKEAIEEYQVRMDDAFLERDKYSTKVRQSDIQIRQYEEYLNRPDVVEKANRLKKLWEELALITEESGALREELAVLKADRERLLKSEPEQTEMLQQKIRLETMLRSYFEEELSLKLVIDRDGRSLVDCAKTAVGMLRESDKNREVAELFQSLYQVYQRHNSSLTNYGTAIENCFESGSASAREIQNSNILRNRVQIVSTWKGKKVYLEEFYKILKTAIDETELLIQKKDRELFEDILSQTISQQLTDKIAESRKWVADMSKLMREMDTSMGLSFSLDWKPCSAENETELDTSELEKILLRDRELLTIEDIEKVAGHFRSKIRTEKMKLEDENGMINYMELVRDALDYRKWFEFHMYFKRGEEPKKLLTNAAFNRFSGGEKAMAMYVPLFAAVNAQYKKAENKDHPRMVALDEAFAGVDDKNISSMFELVQKLDFDYIMNSQALWGCFETVKGLRIAELLRPQNSRTVSVICYTWNGRERILDEQ